MADQLREPTFLILAALAAGPLHGYGIIREVASLSDGRLSLRPGTLYGALDRLSDEALVQADREEVVDGRLRRYYRLTESGAAVLGAEADRLSRIADAAQRRLRERAAGQEAAVGGRRPGPGSAPGRRQSAVRPAGGPA